MEGNYGRDFFEMSLNHGKIFHEISVLTSHNMKTSIPLLKLLNINYSIKPLIITLKLSNFSMLHALFAHRNFQMFPYNVIRSYCENRNIAFRDFGSLVVFVHLPFHVAIPETPT